MTDYSKMTDDELDAAIAEKVMGGKVPIIFRPSRSWSDAGEVEEKMRARPDDVWLFEIGHHRVLAVFRPAQAKDVHAKQYEAVAQTFPRAVCLAALAATEGASNAE